MSVTIGSGHEGNVREQVNAYVARVKGGEMVHSHLCSHSLFSPCYFHYSIHTF